MLFAIVYTNHKDDVEYKRAIGVISRYLDSCDWDNLDNRVFSWDYDVLFFGKNANTMFENTPIPGKRDEMGFVKGVLFDGRFKDNVDWSQQWDGVYSLYELKDFLDEKWIGPNKIEADQDRIYGITPPWMFDLSYLGWRINEMSLDLSYTDLLKVDDKFNDILKTAGMTPELWKRVARKLFYLGTIRWFSRDSFDYTKKNTDNERRRTAEGGDLCGRSIEPNSSLLEALDFYKIDKEEWIKFGDSVISMYDIDQDAELKQYGYYPQLKGMNNNFHLF